MMFWFDSVSQLWKWRKGIECVSHETFLLDSMHSTFQLSPDDLNCLLYKANCYVKTQRFSDAIGEADRILFAYVHATKAQKSKAYAIKGASHYHTGYSNYAFNFVLIQLTGLMKWYFLKTLLYRRVWEVIDELPQGFIEVCQLCWGGRYQVRFIIVSKEGYQKLGTSYVAYLS